MLGRAADAHRQVQLGFDLYAGLAHLARLGQPLVVHDGTRRRQGAAQYFGQFLHHRQILFALNAAAHAHQNVLLRDVHVTGLRLDELFEGDARGVDRFRRRHLFHRRRAVPFAGVGGEGAGDDRDHVLVALELGFYVDLTAVELTGGQQLPTVR